MLLMGGMGSRPIQAFCLSTIDTTLNLDGECDGYVYSVNV